MKKMFYIANIRLPTEKAHGLAVMKMCEALALEGVGVELLVPRRFNLVRGDAFEFYSMRKSFEIRRLPGLDLTNWGRTGFFTQWVSFSGMAVIYSILRRADYYYGRDELSLWLLSFFKKCVVWEAHTAKDNWLVRALLRRVRSIVTISRGLEDHFRRIATIQPRILVAPSAVDTGTFDEILDSKETLRKKLNLPPDQIIVAYVGKRQTMGEDKGVEKFEEAFKIVKEKHERTELLVVSEAIPAEVPLYMKAADILVMNYPNKEHYAKFMSPLKLFEYMASGNPIITSDLPSIREIVDESTVTFFEPDKLKSLGLAVNYIIDNPDEAERKARKALVLVKKYTWIERAKKALEFIQNPS